MAKKKGWSYSQNFIERGVRFNYTKALKVAKYHFDALTALAATGDADGITMLKAFGPVYFALVDASSAKGGNIGSRIGATKTVEDYLLQMIDVELPIWQQSIRNTYGAKTAGYKALFPFGNKPFQTGTRDNIVLTVKTLRDACLADALLAAVAAVIAIFYDVLDTARNTQGSDKSTVTLSIGTQKDAITIMCTLHFQDHGLLINKYSDNADKIASFTDVATLQNHDHGQVYTALINADAKKSACVRKFDPAGSVTVEAGPTDLLIWIAKSAKDKTHILQVKVPANTTLTIPVASIGEPGDRVLMVQNLDPITQGSYEITV